MMVLKCLLLLVGVACAQQQTAPTSGTGQGGTNTLPDANPWYELLSRMMDLMHSSGLINPEGTSQSLSPSQANNQNQAQRRSHGNDQPNEQNSNKQPVHRKLQGQFSAQHNEPTISPNQYQTQEQQVHGKSQGQFSAQNNESAINPNLYQTQEQQAVPHNDQRGQGIERLIQDTAKQMIQNQTQSSFMNSHYEQAGQNIPNPGMRQDRDPYLAQNGNTYEVQRQEQGLARNNRQQFNIPKPPAQQQKSPATQMSPPVTPPPVPDCFWEGRYYTPGSDIVRGQHDHWCYVTYCDSNGKIQFWDDYNCPPNSMRPTSEHNTGRPKSNMGKPPPSVPGCNYKGVLYESGQEINNHQVGERCYGEYCSHESQVVQWEDWCVAQTTIDPLIGGGPGASRQREPSPSSSPSKSAGPKRQGQGPGQAGGAQPKDQANGRKGQGQTGGPHGQGRKSGSPGQSQEGGPNGQGQASQTQSQSAQGASRRRGPRPGCNHNNLYYQPNEDVIVGNIGDLCYGYYCEGDNVFVHWEDKCSPAAINPIVPTAPPVIGTGFFFK